MTGGFAVVVAVALNASPFAVLEMATKVILNPGQCPEPPYDVQACTMPGGCPGTSYCSGLGRWSPCECFASGGEYGATCEVTTTSGGLAVTEGGWNVCTATCGYSCSGSLTWKKSEAIFQNSNSASGLRAFDTVDCGASTTGRCPVLNGSSYSTLSTDVNIQNRTTDDTPAPLSGAGCASGTSGDPCRFAAESTANAVNVRLVPSSDSSNGGPRNELAKLRTTAANDGIIYGPDVAGQSRYYSITVVVPSTADFPAPTTYASGSGHESHGTTFWQMLPVGACGPDQVSMLAIRRTDAGGNNHRGNEWQFTYWVKGLVLGKRDPSLAGLRKRHDRPHPDPHIQLRHPPLVSVGPERVVGPHGLVGQRQSRESNRSGPHDVRVALSGRLPQ